MPTSDVTLSPAELRELLVANPALPVVDVRSAAEYETAHIVGSYNVPLQDLPEHAPHLAGMGVQMVLVCQSGARAAQAEQVLARSGCTRIRLLAGGLNAWEKAGGDVRRGRSTWALERQVRLVAGLIVLVAVVASIWLPWAKWIAGAIGLGLTFAAVSNTCAMGALLLRLPYNRRVTCDTGTVIERLTAATCGGPAIAN